MANYCLIRPLAEEFKRRLKSGEIDPGKLADMSSEERHEYFKGFLGDDNAKNVNALFESKLLLKNQKAGMITWAKKVTGISPDARRDIISRIEKMDKVLNPQDKEQFLKDLASKKLGLEVTQEEAKNIADLSKNIEDAKNKVQENDTPQNRDEMGLHIYKMIKYLDKISPTGKHTLANIVNLPHAAVASLDFSAPFKHGFYSMSDPAWIKNYIRMPGLAGSERAFESRMGQIYGNKYYDTLTKSGLHIFKVTGDLSKREEQFASKFIDKLPLVNSSQRAYTGFLNGLRMDMASKMMKGAELRGDDVSANSKAVKSIVKVVNDLTAASRLPGGLEHSANELSSVLFSPRMQVSRFNMLNPYTYLNPKYTLASRIYQLKNLLGSAAIAASVMGLASAAGLKVGTNPNKTDFGEIHIGDSTIDVSGGNRTLISLLSRIQSGQYINNNGVVTKIGIGNYKPLTRMDLTTSYAVSKLAPGAASIIADFLDQVNGKNPYGETVDIPTELKKQLTPLYISDAMEMYDNDPDHTALAMTLGLFGISVNSSANATQQTDWSQSTSKTLQGFKQAIGSTQFQKANDEYNQQYNTWAKNTVNSKGYQNLSNDGKQTLMQKAKSQIQNKVFSDYGYEPTRGLRTDQQINEDNQINNLLPQQ